MGAFHGLIGVAVVGLNLTVGVLGFRTKTDRDRFWSLAGFAHGALALQVVTGFFLITSTIGDKLGPAHTFAPAVALAGVLAARNVKGEGRVRAVAAASLIVVAIAVWAFVTGFASAASQ
jgi:hypothetical protein